MGIERGFRAKLRYRTDEFLSGGAGRQLLFLFVLTIAVALLFTGLALGVNAAGGELAGGSGFLDVMWFYFTRFLDAGTMGDDGGTFNRFVSTAATITGVVVAGLLISSLAGNFQERLEAIKRGGSAVMEEGHFLVLGWSEKIFSVIDQLSEAYLGQQIVVVVMADHDKIEMEERLRDKVVHQDRMKLVVRSGSSVSLNDLARVGFDRARAIVVLIDEDEVDHPNAADGRVIKTLMALYNHPDAAGRIDKIRVTAEVMLAANQEIAAIASNGQAQVIKTNEIISKIILQTSRISGLSLVYDELLRFEGNEIHFHRVPEVVGRRFGDLLLDFPNGCVAGVAKSDGSSHILNPPAVHLMGPDEELLILAEDENITYRPYAGPLKPGAIKVPPGQGSKTVEHILVLGWNEKIFPVISEFDKYVGSGSTLTLVNTKPVEERQKDIAQSCPPLQNIQLRHLLGDFTSKNVMQQIQPHLYPTVMVLGDSPSGSVEEADTRALIGLLLLRDFRRRSNKTQEVCSEILDPKNRELAATTEIHDIVISNEMVSMVLAQVTYEPRARAVLEDLFQSEGSEIYLKDLSLYAAPGQKLTFEHLILAAKARNEVALGLQIYEDEPSKRYGLVLNPLSRQEPFVAKPGDRLLVLAEDDG